MAIEAWKAKTGKRMNIFYSRETCTAQFCHRDYKVSYSDPFKEIPKKVQQILLFGTDARGDNGTGCWFEGVIPNLQRRLENTESEWVKARLHGYMSQQSCPTCNGTRLRTEALAVRLESADERATEAPPLPINIRPQPKAKIRRRIPNQLRKLRQFCQVKAFSISPR